MTPWLITSPFHLPHENAVPLVARAENRWGPLISGVTSCVHPYGSSIDVIDKPLGTVSPTSWYINTSLDWARPPNISVQQSLRPLLKCYCIPCFINLASSALLWPLLLVASMWIPMHVKQPPTNRSDRSTSLCCCCCCCLYKASRAKLLTMGGWLLLPNCRQDSTYRAR